MPRPKTPPSTHAKRTNIMLSPEAIAVLAKLPNRQRSAFICKLITEFPKVK